MQVADGSCCRPLAYLTQVSPCSTAYVAAEVRERTTSWVRMLLTCLYELQCPPVLALGLMMIFSVTYSA